MSMQAQLRSRPLLIVTALVVGFAVQAADVLMFSSVLGRPAEIDEPHVFVVNALLTAMPMIALALQRRQHLGPWIVGFGVSVGLTYWWLKKGIAYQLKPDGSGVDLGGAVIMLFAPFAITAACLWLNHRLSPEAAESS